MKTMPGLRQCPAISLRSHPEERRIESIRARGRSDLAFFAKVFLPGVCRLPPSDLHRYLQRRRLEKIALDPPERRGCVDVVIAPRGAAKSTLVSLVFPIHALLYGCDPYIILLSATDRQAETRLANIRQALLGGPRLRRCFAQELGRLCRSSRSVLQLGDSRIEAFGAGCELRGITFGRWRPTWIVLDDVETGSRVFSQAYRDDLAAWLNEVVENLGNGYTNIDLIGTMLHHDSLAARLARRPDVTSRTFRSIINEAVRQDLWTRWRSLFFDLADPSRVATARAFFESNKAEMLRGSEVLWDRKESYYDLQLMRVARGERAFEKEKQNNPAADESAMFPETLFPRFTFEGSSLVVRPPAGPVACPAPPRVDRASLRVFGFLDPALGESGRSGDCAAIVTVGIDPCGYLFVLDAWLGRAGPSEQLARLFDLNEHWRYQEFGIEVNAFQRILLDPLARERERRRAAGRSFDLPVREVRHIIPKSVRITALEPLVRSGWLLLREDLPREFMAQLTSFPGGRHDDGPDALAAAVELARAASAGLADLRPVSSSSRNSGCGRGY